jgi:hypothetical protein
MLSTIISSVISLFLILFVGVYASKKGIITPAINNALIDILMKLTLPLLILSSYMSGFDAQVKNNVYQAFYYSLITHIFLFAISYILLIAVKGNKRDVMNFSNIFTNTGFIGFPLLNAAYGPEGVIYGTAYNMIFNIFLWSYGIMLYKGKGKDNNIKKEMLDLLKNPIIITILIGLFIMVFSIEVPQVLYSSIKLVGDITGPLSMIVVGVILSNVNFKENMKDWKVHYAVISKLIIIPLLIALIFHLMGKSSLVTKSIVLQVAMPTATLASIFAEKYNKELGFSTILVVLTTLFSVLTIPAFVVLLQYI